MGVGVVCGAPVGRWCLVQGGACPQRVKDAERVERMRDRLGEVVELERVAVKA